MQLSSHENVLFKYYCHFSQDAEQDANNATFLNGLARCKTSTTLKDPFSV
jgi:hypothetical protein